MVIWRAPLLKCASAFGQDLKAAVSQRFRSRITAFIACLDEKVDDLYYTSRAAIETVKYVQENQPERQTLLKAVDKAFLVIDWSAPGSEGFYDSLYQAQSLLNEEIEEIPKNYPITVTAIGYTHIDVAWLWRLKHTREKAARSFSTVLRLMEQFPEYIFLQTQPQLYEYIKKDGFGAKTSGQLQVISKSWTY